ncbi:SH3 domain-containing protein [Caldanaerobacter subterraneus]|uniref:SH3b domain-containing protein n=1 Tax=Caldanaerobacter subterraneus subsp. pacificus DSM 12653 TaxID=391606 RepID=B7R6S1_9THEO|nr:SH3 domain-containing protein [Caldanaerobacter subterraneus]KKC30920.1 hypothetical protein CDSM653_00017 [Caldanaerobacter subterraneus subsp. pacificus DSM 12653]
MEYIGRPYSKLHSSTHVGQMYHPKVRVSFHTDEGLFSFESGFPDPTSELVSVQTQKSLSQPTGTATITLVPRQVGFENEPKQNWFYRVNPMDFFTIEMKEDIHSPWVTVMTGFVDQVRQNFVSGNKPQRVITITGSDFGKILTRSNFDAFHYFKDVNDTQAFIKTKGVVNLYQSPDLNSPIVGTLQAGMIHEVVNQVGDFYYIVAQRFGYGYVYANDVELFKNENTKATETAKRLKELLYSNSVMINEGGNLVSGLYWNLVLSGKSPEELGNYFQVDAMKNTFINWIYKTWNITPIVYGKDGRQVQADLPSLLRFIIHKPIDWADFVWIPSAATSLVGSIWTYLLSLSCLPFGEMWVDVRDDIMHPLIPWEDVAYSTQMFDKELGTAIDGGLTFNGAKNVFVWRPVPYDKKDWDNLVMHKINYKLIQELDLGRTDFEVITAYWTAPLDIGFDPTKGMASEIPCLLDSLNAAKYGLQTLRITLPAYNLYNTAEIAEKKLYQWYKDNPNFLEGTIKIKGKPNIRIGQRLYIEDTGESFYIESVKHDFTVFEGYTTTIEVNRGMVRGDNWAEGDVVSKPYTDIYPRATGPQDIK